MHDLNDMVRHRFAYRTLVRRPGPATPAGGGGPIVVGLDGSEASRGAAEQAAAQALAMGVEVVAVHAMPLLTELLHDIPPQGLGQWRKGHQLTVTEVWCEPFRRAGVAYRLIVAERPVLTALLGVASHEQATRIVIGATTTGHHHLVGGLGERLRRRASCSVVTVPLGSHPSQVASPS